ncbi:hypothetical protein [Rapidithrix thailandica]|uniref:hypothetical protein n=1 Tax=Rapidithrix thailandica TaxID=413964 RepID=UPI003D2A0D9A
MRQRCARLVRKNLAFSKTWENHWLAIWYFLYHYNLDKLAKNPFLSLVNYPNFGIYIIYNLPEKERDSLLMTIDNFIKAAKINLM